jgi:hypothetical protein
MRAGWGEGPGAAALCQSLNYGCLIGSLAHLTPSVGGQDIVAWEPLSEPSLKSVSEILTNHLVKPSKPRASINSPAQPSHDFQSIPFSEVFLNNQIEKSTLEYSFRVSAN